ncbi:MAG: hypothetical protein M1830_007510 [Pleopsidium flavum]|nr:MAG: hypothetical protein M1830_007510 [Pleopsidium flavum]
MANLLPFRDINVHASPSQYAFTSPSAYSSPTLVVDRPSGDLRLIDGTLQGARRVSSIAGILGIIKLRLDKYIIIITKAQPMGRLRGHMVYKVIATEFLPLHERELHDPDEDTCLSLLKSLLKTGPMYFSYSFDVTNSFQRQCQTDPTAPLWKRADDRFFWNRFIQTDLIDFRTGGGTGSGARSHSGQQTGVDPFILPVMFGMMRITATRIKSTPLTFTLITRRSRHRAGTRYFSRGIDDQGHVSNYNETEQIVVLNDAVGGLGGFAGGGGMQNGKIGGDNSLEMQVLSYVQTRGSVPVYWAEVNDLHYVPKLQVRGVETAVKPAKKHFEEQIRLYGDNYLVNLVNQKGREDRVKKAYEQMIRILVSSPSESTSADRFSDEKYHMVESSRGRQEFDRLHYIYFDFHNETKGLKWHRAQLLLDQLHEGLIKGQYFRGADMPGDSTGRLEVRNSQTAVVRTNCMDCLDRTNVVQSMLARWTLTRQLIDLGVLQRGESASDDTVFEVVFRNVWADNADVVSKSYSGTGALKTDFTRTGKRTRAGMVQDLNNSVTRYVRNNFTDGPRQDSFDLFLGTYLPSDSNVGSILLFIDPRPAFIQAIPFILGTSLVMVTIAALTHRLPDSTVWPLRFFVLLWLLVGGWCLHFIVAHGKLYVNWPRLNTPPWATEGYQEAINSVRKDKIIGQLIGRHERGDAVAALNTLQSNFSIVDAIRKSGRGMNQQAIAEMNAWCRRLGYEPSGFNRLKPIHIAGTKGKGSTSAFISSILSQYLPSSTHPKPQVHKIGLYTSPHLRFVRERIQINNAPLSEEVFAKYFFQTWDRLEDAARADGQPTDTTAKPVYFRFLTLMALHTYMSEGVDTAIVECGIGGEYDSTNILIQPTVTGITSLGIDHVAMLGGTIEEIAWHKAGIMKPGALAFTVPQPEGAMTILRQRAEEKGVGLHVVDRHPELETIKLGLAADFQKTNASLAIAIAAAHLRALGHIDIPPDITTALLPAEFRRGLEQVQWGGRCETRKEHNITWYIDGGHTLESIDVAGKWFASQIQPSPTTSTPHSKQTRVLIFNQQTRDAGALTRALHGTLAEALDDEKPFTHAIFCSNITFKDAGFRPDLVSVNTNAVDLEDLSVQKGLARTWAEIDAQTEVQVVRTIEEAVGLVRGMAGKEARGDDVMVLVTGSVHLVGGFLEVLESGERSGGSV